MKDGFNITILDNFFEKKLFDKIYNKISYINYNALTNKLLYSNGESKHPWFASPIEKDLVEIIKTKCEKIWRKKFKVGLCSYTMLSTVEPLPHCDLTEETDHQIIIYIKGNTDLHKGTGFYLNQQLNTHIGFNENRAITWHSNTWHTPLNWASDDKSKRFSILCQLKEIK
tara:strand:- start:288 stop:797 length:510 start_codon:yes stop_codon:yes gene_type:complete